MRRFIVYLLVLMAGFGLGFLIAGLLGERGENHAISGTPAVAPPVQVVDYTYTDFLSEAGGTLIYTEGLTGWEVWSLKSGHTVNVAPRAGGTATVNNVAFDASIYQLPGGAQSFSCIPLKEVEVRGLGELIVEMDLFRQNSLTGKVAYTETYGAQTAKNDQLQCSIS